MGYYIEVERPTQKAKQLVEQYNAELVLSPEAFDFSGSDALICVVENGPFDAAAIAYDEAERNDFLPTARDQRPRTWLKMPKTKAMQLCPQVGRVFNP